MKLSRRTMTHHRREKGYVESHLVRATRYGAKQLPSLIVEETLQLVGLEKVLKQGVQGKADVLH